MTIAYERVEEDEQGKVSARDGVARIEVRNLEGRVVEEALGRTSSTGSALGDDFDSTQSTLENAFQGELFERVTSRYDGPALLERARWLDAEDPQGSKYVTQYKYDAAGRPLAVYRSFDTDEEGEQAPLEAASNVTDDVVLEEERYQYDALGREIFRVRYERKAEETGDWPHEGALSGPLSEYARRSCVGSWYSPSGRLTATVDFGESSLSERPADVPGRANTELVTTYEEGWGRLAQGVAIYPGQPSEPHKTSWLKVTDAAENAHYRVFDNLGRLIREIRDHEGDGQPGTKTKSGVTVQKNVTSSFEYDGLDRVVRALAHHEYAEPPGAYVEEVTAYEYGVRKQGDLQYSDLDSNDLLWRVLQGRRENGAEQFSRQSVYAYDRQGSVKKKGAGQYDPPVFRTWHSYSRDLPGRLTLDAVSAPGGGVDLTIDEIAWRYDSHGRPWAVFSNPGEGFWPEDFANAVVFEYDVEGNLVSETQDHGDGWSKVLPYAYTGDGGYPVPRLSGIMYPSGRTVSYVRNWGSEWPDFVGLDPFGRVRRLCAWTSGGTAAMDYPYSYDRFHAPLGRGDEGLLSRWETFLYDDVEWLVRFERESESARVWELTAAGNWDAVKDGESTTDDRSHNERNEITLRPAGGAVPEYDFEGNTTGVPVDQVADFKFPFVYDGWNRLVEVRRPGGGDPPLRRYTAAPAPEVGADSDSSEAREDTTFGFEAPIQSIEILRSLTIAPSHEPAREPAATGADSPCRRISQQEIRN